MCGLPVIPPPSDNEEIHSGRGLHTAGLLTHPVHPPHSSLASLKNMGSEPFFTLADHITPTHTHAQTHTHTLGDLVVHSGGGGGVSASVPSTPWSNAWHHSVLSIIKSSNQFQGKFWMAFLEKSLREGLWWPANQLWTMLNCRNTHWYLKCIHSVFLSVCVSVCACLCLSVSSSCQKL